MAGAVAASCVSPLMSLPSTHLLFLSSSPLFPSKSPHHRYYYYGPYHRYYYGACRYGNPKLTIRHGSGKFSIFQLNSNGSRADGVRHGSGKLKSNGSRAEEVQEEIEDDNTFFQLMEEDIDDEDDDDTESSLDLLFRFLYSMFKKLSKRARKASRAVLPEVISPQLVSFSVDGVLLLASLSILKALLEVVCTLGGTVFVIVLMLRVIWAAVSYFQSSANNFSKSGPSYNRTQPIT